MKKNLLLSFIVLSSLFSVKSNAQTWVGLGGGGANAGANNTVWAITVNPANGDMYAAGAFTSVDSPAVSASQVAKWNGTSWSAMGAGLTGGVVRALAWYGNTLYAGGLFTMTGSTACNYLAKWNGTTWIQVGALDQPVYALQVFGANLFVGGQFTTPSLGAAKWDGTTLSAAGFTSGVVYCFTLYNNNTDLFAGGTFSGRVAKWVTTTSTWDQLTAAGLAGNVYAMTSLGTYLYASGQLIYPNPSPTTCLAKWTSGGSGWSNVGNANFTPTSPAATYPYALITFNGYVYVGGNFANLIIGSATCPSSNCFGRIVKWDGTSWSNGITQTVLNNVNAFGAYSPAVGNKYIYAGGLFTYPFHYVMRSPAPVGIEEESLAASSLSIYPNPSHGAVNVRILAELKNPKAEIYNLLGTKVFSQTLDSKNQSLNVTHLSTGVYFLKIVSEAENGSGHYKSYVQKLLIE